VSISKYELLADMRESKLGVFWNFANPAIQVLTYWFVFGYVFNRKDVQGIPYLVWMLGGMVVWFYVSPCITDGCNSVYKKVNVITKMKFPVSILPMTVVLEKLFDHFDRHICDSGILSERALAGTDILSFLYDYFFGVLISDHICT
jgi:teichoic acid transport system permease protein